jgi:hypothetical protein
LALALALALGYKLAGEAATSKVVYGASQLANPAYKHAF